MQIYRLEQVRLEPLVVIADNFDDAARIFLEGLEHGLGKRVTASFAVSAWKLKQGNARDILHDFASQGLKGLVWPTEEGWELIVPHTPTGLAPSLPLLERSNTVRASLARHS